VAYGSLNVLARLIDLDCDRLNIGYGVGAQVRSSWISAMRPIVKEDTDFAGGKPADLIKATKASWQRMLDFLAAAFSAKHNSNVH
jgi:hypothetical protein